MPAAATLIQLRAFVTAADAGSFGRAAVTLGLSPSSVSESVQALEQLHGQPLFRRSPRGIALTPTGERALPHARLTVQHSEDFALAMDERRALEGVLTLATFRSLGVHLLPPVLALLRRGHPRLHVGSWTAPSAMAVSNWFTMAERTLPFSNSPLLLLPHCSPCQSSRTTTWSCAPGRTPPSR